MVKGRPAPDPALVGRVAPLALALPEVVEEDSWAGVRWRVRGRTVAHVYALSHREAATQLGVDDTTVVTVVSVHCDGEERDVLLAIGPPYLGDWSPGMVVVVLDDRTDWGEVGELVTESYRLLAPQHLRRRLDDP